VDGVIGLKRTSVCHRSGIVPDGATTEANMLRTVPDGGQADGREADGGEALLRLRDLRVSYPGARGPVHAVRGVDLTLRAGRVLGLAGESGCGKSTLAATVLRLQSPSAKVSGQVMVDGENVLTMGWGRLRGVRWGTASIVFQGALHALNPVLRIGHQIADPIIVHEPATTARQAATRAAELLELVGLAPARAQQYPHQLSGGQRQRVMIAMALACSPRLLVADEPTSLVRELGLGLLLISHDLSLLATMCDRVAVMYAGRIVEESPAEAVLGGGAACQGHPYVAGLAAALPVVGDPASRRRPRGLDGDPPYPGEKITGCAFRPRCSAALGPCAVRDPVLHRAGPDRAVACLRVDDDGAWH
jgi:peptide/nickel transport system ATP-binding protein